MNAMHAINVKNRTTKNARNIELNCRINMEETESGAPALTDRVTIFFVVFVVFVVEKEVNVNFDNCVSGCTEQTRT